MPSASVTACNLYGLNERKKLESLADSMRSQGLVKKYMGGGGGGWAGAIENVADKKHMTHNYLTHP